MESLPVVLWLTMFEQMVGGADHGHDVRWQSIAKNSRRFY